MENLFDKLYKPKLFEPKLLLMELIEEKQTETIGIISSVLSFQ
jgi:hypothetical protein